MKVRNNEEKTLVAAIILPENYSTEYIAVGQPAKNIERAAGILLLKYENVAVGDHRLKNDKLSTYSEAPAGRNRS